MPIYFGGGKKKTMKKNFTKLHSTYMHDLMDSYPNLKLSLIKTESSNLIKNTVLNGFASVATVCAVTSALNPLLSSAPQLYPQQMLNNLSRHTP